VPRVTADRDSAVPMYVQIADQIREQILSGELRARVPSVKTISEEAGVSKIVGEMAMKILKDEGLIEVSIGRGAYVKKPRHS